MAFMTIKAHAKINLSIDVLKKRPDGYHEVKMIMQTIGLHDLVRIERAAQGIELGVDKPGIPCGDTNTAFRAAQLLMGRHGIKSGVRIHISKNIPAAAGLAGGSADAAAVLTGMNEMFSLGLKESELMSYGKEIGADVPFCIKGGTMLAEGIGDILTALSPLPETYVVLVRPSEDVSTKWVYQNLDLGRIADRPDTALLVRALEEKRVDRLASNMRNVLETVTLEKCGIIASLKERLIDYGAAGSMMSGSGPTVFGIFLDSNSAFKAFEAFKNEGWNCFLTCTVNRAQEEEEREQMK